MKATKDPIVYLEDIHRAIEQIERYTVAGKQEFSVDEKTQDAVIRQLSIIGEAASRVPRTMRAAHPEIPWKKVVAMRNILIHEYSATSIKRVWDTIEQHLPKLKPQIEAMLEEAS